jgi:two-component system, NtrC family, C4-dicarboxylate transport response regulator DctD
MSITCTVERDSIAIVEDEEDLANLFKEALSYHGFKITSFTDSTAAFEQISLHHLEYRLVLSDIRMPRINGLELIRRISKRDGNIKFILMSAFDQPDLSADLPGPTYEFIQKPVGIEKLREIVYRNATQTY